MSKYAISERCYCYLYSARLYARYWELHSRREPLITARILRERLLFCSKGLVNMSVQNFDQDAYWAAVYQDSGGAHLQGDSCFIDCDPDEDPSFFDGEEIEVECPICDSLNTYFDGRGHCTNCGSTFRYLDESDVF